MSNPAITYAAIQAMSKEELEELNVRFARRFALQVGLRIVSAVIVAIVSSAILRKLKDE